MTDRSITETTTRRDPAHHHHHHRHYHRHHQAVEGLLKRGDTREEAIDALGAGLLDEMHEMMTATELDGLPWVCSGGVGIDIDLGFSDGSVSVMTGSTAVQRAVDLGNGYSNPNQSASVSAMWSSPTPARTGVLAEATSAFTPPVLTKPILPIARELLDKKMSLTEPTPFEKIPTYIVDGLDRQDAPTLEAIEEYARARRDHLHALEARTLEEDELAAAGEEVVDVEDGDGGTVVIKKVPCGKECGGCPHGPYKYIVRREGGSLDWEYKGRVTDA